MSLEDLITLYLMLLFCLSVRNILTAVCAKLIARLWISLDLLLALMSVLGPLISHLQNE